jgi:ABC-type phosphate/phosphonate transport system substrate-binding protein
VVRKDLRPEIKQRLKSVLLAAHLDPEAKAALEAYQRTTQFDAIDESVREGIERSRSILTSVKEGLGL